MRIYYSTIVNFLKDDGPGINERGFLRALDEYKDVDYFRPPSGFFGEKKKNLLLRFFSSASGQLKYMNRVYRDLKKGDYDLWMLRLSPFGIELCLLWLWKGDVHLKLLNRNMNLQRRSNGLLLGIADLVKSFFLGLFKNRILTVDTPSHYFIPDLTSVYNLPQHKIGVVPNGADVSLIELDSGSVRDIDIVYAGIIDTSRGLALLPDVFDIIKENDLRVYLIGHGPYFDELKRLVKSNGLAEYIFFTGKIPMDEVLGFYKRSKFGLDLSLFERKAGGEVIYGSFSQKIPQYLCNGIVPIVWEIKDLDFIQKGDAVKLDVESQVDSFRSALRDIRNYYASVEIAALQRKYMGLVSYDSSVAQRLEFISKHYD